VKKNLFYHPESKRLFTSIEVKTVDPSLGVNTPDRVLKSHGLYRMIQTEIPTIEPDQHLVELEPTTDESGNYCRRFEARDLFEDLDEDTKSIARRDFLMAFFQREKQEKILQIRKNSAGTLKKGFESSSKATYSFEAISDLVSLLSLLQLQPDLNEFCVRSKDGEIQTLTAEELKELTSRALVASQEIAKTEKKLIEELSEPEAAESGRFSQVKELFEKIKQLPKEDLE
jgi:hypothetical protein